MVYFKQTAVAEFETGLETVAEDAHYGYDSTCRGYDKFPDDIELIPSEHHESDGGCEEEECHQRRQVEFPCRGIALFHRIGGFGISRAHTLFK